MDNAAYVVCHGHTRGQLCPEKEVAPTLSNPKSKTPKQSPQCACSTNAQMCMGNLLCSDLQGLRPDEDDCLHCNVRGRDGLRTNQEEIGSTVEYTIAGTRADDSARRFRMKCNADEDDSRPRRRGHVLDLDLTRLPCHHGQRHPSRRRSSRPRRSVWCGFGLVRGRSSLNYTDTTDHPTYPLHQPTHSHPRPSPSSSHSSSSSSAPP